MRTGRYAATAAFIVINILSSSEAWAKKITFETAPVTQGRVFIDGKFVGVSPVTVDLKIPDNGMVARAEKEGSLGLWSTAFDKNQNGAVMIRLEEDQAFKQTIASDIANKWQTIEPSAKVDESEAWKKIVSIVTDNFSDIEQLDRNSFYMRTAWKVRRYAYSITRQRLVIKRGITPNLTIKVEVESQLFHFNPSAIAGTQSPSPRDEDYVPSERVFVSDAETVRNLREQL